ncbi:MAG: S24/S26 family peptidase [Chloroflexi bacterium]|nr:S24/S26 family peptidase [Chloroflexota bacterium]
MSRARWCAAALGLAVAIQLAGVRLLVVSGNSMSPSIRDGDLVLTARLWRGGAVGDIVLVERPSDGQLLLHRVIEQGTGWRRTQGDASLSPDAERISDAAVLGVLAAVIPTGLIAPPPLGQVATQFSSGRRVGLSIAAAPGARAEVSTPVIAGADALGQLLPGGRATWTLTLTPCPAGITGECAGATNTLRIDPDRFTLSGTNSAARALRITSTCRPVGTTTWTASADLFTATWSATNLATGRLATYSAGAAASECQVQVTLLGEITAMSSSVTLPLRWGPE